MDPNNNNAEPECDSIEAEKAAAQKLADAGSLEDVLNNNNEKKLSDDKSDTSSIAGSEKSSVAPKVVKPPPKSGDHSTKHPFSELSEYSWGMNLIRLIVFLFDVITYPIYVIIQKPWLKRAQSKRIRSKRENPDDPYSAYVRTDKNKACHSHYVFKPQTIPEFQQLSLKLTPRNSPSLGYREIVSVTHETQRNGKRMMKLNLTDYKWLTIEEVDERITNLHKSFLANGVKFQEKVLIFAETRMGKYFFFCHAHFLYKLN